MKTFLASALALGVTATATLADAPVTLSGTIAALETRGYTIREVDVHGSWIEVDAISGEGLWVELIVDAGTAEVLGERIDD